MILKAVSFVRSKANSYVLKQVGFLEDDLNIETSIIMPVFNQEKIIQKNLEALKSSIGTISELIIINDASEDDTNAEILQFMSDFLPVQNKLRRIKYFSFKKQNFETYCDFFGISQSSGKFILEVQADMRIIDPNFDQKMIRNLRNNPDIFMLSGRGIMSFNEILGTFRKSLGNEAVSSTSILRKLVRLILKNHKQVQIVNTGEEIVEKIKIDQFQPSEEDFRLMRKAGRLGRLVDTNPEIQTMNLYVGETVMRGPICFNKDRYYLVGQFNKNAFFLGFDEHDLNLRARLRHGFKAGYLPISFESPLEFGSMRKTRSKKSRLELLLAVKRTQPSLKRSQIYSSASQGGLSFHDHEVREAT